MTYRDAQGLIECVEFRLHPRAPRHGNLQILQFSAGACLLQPQLLEFVKLGALPLVDRLQDPVDQLLDLRFHVEIEQLWHERVLVHYTRRRY